MTNDLLDFQVRMLFCCVIVKQCLQVIQKVVLIVGNLQVGHHYVVRSVGPAIVVTVVNAVSLAGKVESLLTKLTVLLQEGTPLNGSHRPV